MEALLPTWAVNLSQLATQTGGGNLVIALVGD
jgi:hypothetical protein